MAERPKGCAGSTPAIPIMFEQLIIHNFQKWKHYILDFDELLTVLVGNTDAGKSTIVRALRWVCLNKPPRKGKFINWDADTAEVELKVSGHSIIRRQGPKENCYILDDKKFVAIGAGNVPPEIEEILNVDTDNFHKQLDSHFWFSDTAGDVGKKLNSIVNLSVIDRSMTKIASMLKKARGVEDLTQTRLDQARRRKEELQWIVQFDEQLSTLEAKQLQTTQISKKATRLRAMAGKGQMLAKHVTTCQNASQTLQSLCEKVVQVVALQGKIDVLQKLVQKCKKLSKIKQPPDISRVVELKTNIDDLEYTVKSLNILVNKANQIKWNLNQTKQILETSQKDIEETFGKTCQTCFQPLT